MRAADQDRQEVVDRLRAALADGRLTMDEYLDRMGRAYQAVTYGDLAPLHADLPAAGPRAAPSASPPSAASGAPAAAVGLGRGGAFAALPAALRVLWTIWLMAVSVNVVIWALVSVSGDHLAYPWPMWVAGPWGAMLFAQSVVITQVRRGRPGATRSH